MMLSELRGYDCRTYYGYLIRTDGLISKRVAIVSDDDDEAASPTNG
jgi:hypothetical protein